MASFNTKQFAGHRSNALGFAKHDCHTCAAAKQRCDRQRPQCGTCALHRRKCSGFEVNLVWKDLAVGNAPATKISAKAPLKFKQGRQRKKRASSDSSQKMLRKNQEKLGEMAMVKSGVQYQSLMHKYEAIIGFYDREFCVMPLTFDSRVNPYRVPLYCLEKYAFLRHAVIAVAMHHVAKQKDSRELAVEMHSHWSTSAQLFRQALAVTKVQTLLDTLLILFSLEATQTACGTWGVHLKGAKKLLEMHGSVAKCCESPRLRSQIAMLAWWDVTTALLSRRAPHLSIEYLETLASYSGRDNGWSCFSLNGCPLELMMLMHRLARAASQADPSQVQQIIQRVDDYPNEADLETQTHGYLCIEAWRHAILLYACRVFGTHDLHQIDRHAQTIFDCVQGIPQTNIVQKQVLIPLFLAAAEVGDSRRAMASSYLSHWNTVSRFYHFDSVARILEGIWKDWTPKTRRTYWWGDKVPAGGWPDGRDPGIVWELMLG